MRPTGFNASRLLVKNRPLKAQITGCVRSRCEYCTEVYRMHVRPRAALNNRTVASSVQCSGCGNHARLARAHFACTLGSFLKGTCSKGLRSSTLTGSALPIIALKPQRTSVAFRHVTSGTRRDMPFCAPITTTFRMCDHAACSQPCTAQCLENQNISQWPRVCSCCTVQAIFV